MAVESCAMVHAQIGWQLAGSPLQNQGALGEGSGGRGGRGTLFDVLKQGMVPTAGYYWCAVSLHVVLKMSMLTLMFPCALLLPPRPSLYPRLPLCPIPLLLPLLLHSVYPSPLPIHISTTHTHNTTKPIVIAWHGRPQASSIHTFWATVLPVLMSFLFIFPRSLSCSPSPPHPSPPVPHVPLLSSPRTHSV